MRHLRLSVVTALLLLIALVGVPLTGPPAAVASATSATSDASVTFDAATKTWTLQTAAVAKTLQLNGSGQFQLTSFRNKLTGHEYLQTGPTDEFAVKAGGTSYSGASTGWVYDTYATSTLSQGELQLTITFHNAALSVTRYYVLYPSTGVIQEWTVFKNVSGGTLAFSDPSIFRQRLMGTDVGSVDFGYMTGGSNFGGSQVYKPLTPAQRGGSSYLRTFDSHDTPEQQVVDGDDGDINSNILGTAVYNELFTLRNTATNEGVFLTFDYLGHWVTTAGNSTANFTLNGRVVMTGKQVPGNGTVTTPKAMTGVFTGDVDDMGNTILDYVYRYKWDYTRDQYFARQKVGQWLGQWIAPNVAETPNAFAAINAARYIGAEGMWIDDEWFDVRGNWNNIYGDDFHALNDYAARNGMSFTAWYPTWHTGGRADLNLDGPTTVDAEHPEYQVADDYVDYYGWHLDNSKPEVIAWQRALLNSKQADWGPHIWRYDGQAVWPAGTNENDMLEQSNNFYALLKQFKDDNPGAGIFGCSSGGEMLTIESARYSDVQQSTDGAIQHFDGYWTTLLTPPDKLSTGSGIPASGGDLSESYDKVMRGELRGVNSWGAGSALTTPTVDKEPRRKDAELYRYLRTQGVAGRWTKVYRPTTSSNLDQTYIQEKLSQDGERGYLTIYNNVSTPGPNPTSALGKNVVIYPKGLNPNSNYTISTAEGGLATTTKTGSAWMVGGISLTPLKRGEVIFLNLEKRPGTGTDHTAPTAPGNVVKQQAAYLSHSGVQLTWNAASDDNWLSYYEILRNGTVIDKVSTGQFYFDVHGTSADTYAVRTVDGDGNASAAQTATKGDPDRFDLRSGFAESQGRNAWSYYSKSGGTYTPMTYNAADSMWHGTGTWNLVGEPARLHPDATADTVVAWTAPRAGTVRVSGTPSKATAGGDGVVARVLRNGSTLWGPQTIAGVDTVGYSYDFTTTVAAGDKLYFELGNGADGNQDFDQTSWNPRVAYNEAAGPPQQPQPPVYDLAKDYSSVQGEKNWFNQEWDGSTYQDLNWVPDDYRWHGSYTYNNLHSPNFMHPDVNDTVKSWTAPKDGTVSVVGSVAKADTGGGDGVRVRILKNGQQVWPASGWQSVAYNNRTGVAYNLSVPVSQGDELHFDLNRGAAGNQDFDLTSWKATLTYTG